MPETPASTTLQTCLQNEFALIVKFTETLRQEADMLAKGAEIETLGSITQEKNTFADQLAHQAQIRNTVLQEQGFPPDRTGLTQAVLRYPALADDVQQLLHLTEQARLLNLGNGQIIERYLHHHQQALDVLHHLTGRSQLYDASGRTRPTQKPRTGHNKRA